MTLPREESPTRHFVRALGLTPIASGQAAAEAPCTFCGRTIEAGEPANRFHDNGSFMEWHALSICDSEQGEMLCQDCAAVWSRVGMQYMTRAVISPDGIFPVGALGAQAWFLLHPPQPPFVFAIATTTNQQHLWWRASVNHSREAFSVQYGDRRVRVNRQRLEGLPELIAEFRDRNSTSTTRPMPFFGSLDTHSPTIGEVRPQADYDWPTDLRERLLCLGPDDFWVLYRIGVAKEIACPNPIDPKKVKK